MMVVDNKYEFGQEVYLKTDTDQKIRIVTGLCIRPNGCINYEVACGTESKWHYDFEMTTEKDVVKSTTG